MIPPPAGTTEAILLHPAGVASLRASRFLSLLGVETVAMSGSELLAQAASARSRCLVLSGPDAILLADLARKQGLPPGKITAPYGAVVFHSLDPQSAALQAMGDLVGGVRFSAGGSRNEPGAYRVSSQHPDVCGPLSGLVHGPINSSVDWGLDVGSTGDQVEKLIEIDGRGLLTLLGPPDRPVLIAATTEIQDLMERMTTNIDFRPRFSRVAPLLVALRSVFRTACWIPQQGYANITIDDPPLWPKYGHLDLRRLAEVVDRLPCAATIGMIPWNYRRSRQPMADLFIRQAPRLGICYHGCDHTGEEFGLPDEAAMRGLFELARHRMEQHQRLTGLDCQPVMIFPQGVFSTEAMRALAATGCLAVVSTECQDHQRQMMVTAGDLMLPALICYGDPPLFVRRKPSDGPVNFALDLFLGRPLIIVTHHDFYQDGFGAFEETVRSISSLDRNLVWENLQNIVTACSLRKAGKDGKPIVRRFTRQNPPESRPVPLPRQGMSHRLRIAARRYASEFRDNYLAKFEFTQRYTRRLAKFLRNY